MEWLGREDPGACWARWAGLGAHGGGCSPPPGAHGGGCSSAQDDGGRGSLVAFPEADRGGGVSLS
jgi:hypothetical protein